ncbi:hypothetical protein ACFL9T_15205 [Thermodesulfobacteriota bacterium]
MSNTPQGEAIVGNAADDAWMVDQGEIDILPEIDYIVNNLDRKRKA